jgi:predicted transcriptional regulator
MRVKKINDETLQEMIKEGKQQKEVAEFFNVSEAAISKRLKRLNQSAPPESFNKLSPGEKKFVLAKVEGKSSSASALEAFNCGSIQSAKAMGSKLACDPDIQIAISDLMHQTGIGRRRRVERLRDLIEANDMGIVAKGLDMANRLTGDYAPEKIDMNAQMMATHRLIAFIKGANKQEVIDADDMTD